jgi:hypothetical protein
MQAYLFVSAYLLASMLIALIRAAQPWGEFQRLLARVFPSR